MSAGSTKLLQLLLNIFGSEVKVFPEYSVGEALRLDFYLPDYKLGWEWHGRQHMEFVEHFHGDKAGFIDSQNRDRRKLELCAEQGIMVVVFWDHEELTEELVLERIAGAKNELNQLYKAPVENAFKNKVSEIRKEQRKKYLESDAHAAALEQGRQRRKEQYRWMKERKQK